MVLLLTVFLCGVRVTDLLVTVPCLGELTVVDLFVTVLFAAGLLLLLIVLLSTRFVRSTAVLPAILRVPFDRASLLPRTVLPLLTELPRFEMARLLRVSLFDLLATVLFERVLLSWRTATLLSFR